MHICIIIGIICKSFNNFFSAWKGNDVVTAMVAIASLVVSYITFRESRFQKNVSSNQYKLSLFQLRKEVYDSLIEIFPDINEVSNDFNTIAINIEIEKKLSPYQYIFDSKDPGNPIEKFKEKLFFIKNNMYKPRYAPITAFLEKNSYLTIDDMDKYSYPVEIEEFKNSLVELNILSINVILYIRKQLELPSDPTTRKISSH